MKHTLLTLLAWLAVAASHAAAPPAIRFEAITGFVSVAENAGSLTVGVVRDGAANLIGSVSYRYESPGSTNVLRGQLVFAPGERRQVIVVPVLDDGDANGDRFGFLRLDPFDAINSLQIFIRDNEFDRPDSAIFPIEFFPAAPSALVGGSLAEVTLRRLGDSYAKLTVNVATADLTAKAGVHYVAQTNRVTFAPLETEKTVKVQLLPGPVAGLEVTLELVLNDVEADKPWTNRTTLRLVDGTRDGDSGCDFRHGNAHGPSA